MPTTSHRHVTPAGAVFVASWIAGLLVAPAAPDPDAPAARIAAHFAGHAGATTVQSLLIHGAAGVALVVLAVALRAGRSATAAGIAAGAVSLVQAGIGVALAQHIAPDRSARAAETAFDILNRADTVKLLLLGAFVVLASRGMGRRMRRASVALAPLLAVSGLAFVLGGDALYALLYVSLPALLAWAGAVAIRARGPRRARRAVPAA